MDITKLYPSILQQRVSVSAKAGDILFFNSLITHGPSDNLSPTPQLRCYPNLAPVNYLANPKEEVLDTWLNGTHPKRYGHFFTGNYYKRDVIHAHSARRHYIYQLCPIGKAIVGATLWTDIQVVRDLNTLFGSDKQQRDMLIKQWIDDFNVDWATLVDLQITRYEKRGGD